MNLAVLLAQCKPFLEWAYRYPLLKQRVELATSRIALLTGVAGSSACREMRDCFHVLYMYADEGGFSEIASLFYAQYIQYCRLLLAYYPSR